MIAYRSMDGRRATGSSQLTMMALVLLCSGGCFPPSGQSSDADGGQPGFMGPTLELTVNGVHFGPAVPDPGSAVDLINTRNALGGRVTGSSFRLAASVGAAGCQLAFDRYGDGAALGVGQYRVQSIQGSSTANGTVYPTTAERIATPAGGASCTGTGCDGALLAITALDSSHMTGYFSGTVQADSGAGQAAAICSFWLPLRSYQP